VWNAAIKGDASSQFAMGERYENGEGVTKSGTEAVAWYQKAADQDMPQVLAFPSRAFHTNFQLLLHVLSQAQRCLAQMYLQGDDPNHDPEEDDAPGTGE
jgi:TPR repeat protein